MAYKPSYYNILVPHGPHTLLFNGVSSGLLRLPGELAQGLRPFLGPDKTREAGRGRSEWAPRAFEPDELPEAARRIFPELLKGRFFVEADDDEVSKLKNRFTTAKERSALLLTLTTTMDCNLGCYYCYEDKSKTYLSREGCDAILAYARKKLESGAHDTLYTDWYGGEPMLNQEAIDYFSERAIRMCDEMGIGYNSAMISNGTLWPADAPDFVERNRIRHVQFTLDGPRVHHDRRRRYVLADQKGESSFDRIVETIDNLKGTIRIYLRINVDPASGKDVLSLIPFFLEKEWLGAGARIYPYLALIGPMTDHCGQLGTSKKFLDFRRDFGDLKEAFREEVSRHVDPRGVHHLQYYPATVKMNCAAVGDNSVVFGPDGYMYKCGLDVGVHQRAFDRLPFDASSAERKAAGRALPVLSAGAAAHPYHQYDPFTHTRCGECQYLPVCMGGCPKSHFEKNEFYLSEQSRYWEDNIDSVIRGYYDAAPARMAHA